MAKTDIGPKISVEGEKEYRQQMQNIIQKQKEYAAELKATTASMDENTSAEQRAASVASILRKQIASQTDALNAQKGMLLQATAQYGSASTQASAYRTAIYKSSAELENLKSRLREAESGLSGFAENAEKATDSIEGLGNTNAGADMFSGLQDAVVNGNLAADAIETISQKIIEAGKQIVSTGIQYNAQLEQYQVALTNMLGSESDALTLLDEIKQDAAQTPFDTAGLVKANQLLVSTGISAEDSRRTILALGDAISATGGGNDELSRMAQNLQQIQNAGKATSADIKQFAYAGIDVYGILADYTGKTTEEVQKMSVTYDLMSNALIAAAQEGGRYFSSMNTQSETLTGKWNTLNDNATQLAGLMTQDLTNGVKVLIGNMNDLVLAASKAYDSGGWYGLADAIASNIPIVAQLKTGFENATTAAINFLDKASYALNKGLGKNAYANYDSYEDYRKDQDKKNKQTEQYRASERERREKKHQERLRQAKAEKSANYTVPSYTGTGGSSTQKTKKAAQDTKKLAKTVTDTSTQLLKGSENIVGAISRTTETATKTYNVYDGTTKKLKGTTTDTVQTITDSWTEMVNGVEKQFKRVKTLTNGVVTDEKTTSSAAQQAASQVAHTTAQYLTGQQAGVNDAIGYINRSTQTTQKTQKVLNETTGQLEDTIVSTTQVVTDCYKRIVDGQEQTVQRSTTYVNGVVTDIQEKVADVESAAKQVDHTSTKYMTGQQAGIDEAVGYVNRASQTTQETKKVLDETTGEMVDTVVSTTEVVTDCYKRIVDGQEQTVQRTTTYVDGVATDIQEKVADVEAAAKKVVSNRTENLTSSESGIDEAIGYVNRASQTTQQTKKVLDETTGEMVDTVVSTTQVVTDCYKRIVDGQEQTVERTTTYVDGVVTDIQEKTTDLNTDIKYTEGVLGGFSKFVLDLDTKLGGLEKAASNLTKSPLGQWFSDLANGYRASDSFWDNIDVGSLLAGGILSFATGFATTGSWQIGLVKAGVSIVGNLLGTDLSGLANESNGWGADLIKGFAEGMKGAGKWLTDAVSWAGNLISSYLHFSRPDEGPLREYESWMPDMVKGMANGIKDNAYLLQNAAADLSGKLKMQLQYDVGSASAMMQTTNVRRTVRIGGVTMNVYPSSDMDAESFAQYTINRLTQMINEEEAASGEVPVF